MQQLTAILVDGTVYFSWLFIVSLGLTLIYGVMKILNVAHGSLFALGAYMAATVIGVWFAGGWPPMASFAAFALAGLLVGAFAGLVIERSVLARMYGQDPIVVILATYAVFLILEDVITLIWGLDPYLAFQPYTLLGRVRIFGISFSVYDLCLIGAALFLAAASWLALTKTRQGKLLLVVIHDREISSAMGINVRLMFGVTFVIGAGVGALGGALSAPGISVVPGVGVDIIVLAFAVTVIGGLGSIPGALVGALIVGLCRAAAVHLRPEAELFVIYAVMALVLAFRSQGLFGQTVARKI